MSVALANFPSSFPTLYIATVRASERTGAIAEALRRFVTYQQQIDLLKKRLVNASIYPAVLLAAGSLVVLFLVTYVVPRFSGIYEDIGGELGIEELVGFIVVVEFHGVAAGEIDLDEVGHALEVGPHHGFGEMPHIAVG